MAEKKGKYKVLNEANEYDKVNLETTVEQVKGLSEELDKKVDKANGIHIENRRLVLG